MKKFLDRLVDLSGLRDRDELEFALVMLIGHCDQWTLQSTHLVRAIGHLEDQRWLSRAHMNAGQTRPTRDLVWSDWTTLPKLADFPLRQAAVTTANIVSSGGSPCITVFPIDTHLSVCSLLEVESEQPLSPAAQALIASALRLYLNLQGLLDYGEKDSLTELLNRKSFDGAFLRAALEQDDLATLDGPERRAHEISACYWLAVIDIDHFKRVNDNFGHLIGDEVLLLIAGLMRSNFRFHDQIYRFGGEEFVVLMRCADHTDAAAALERFRAKVESFEFPQVGTIRVSVGFSALRSDDTPGTAFDRADKAVYYAKANGRNQVCSYSVLVQAGELTETLEITPETDFF
jgi:diguanylate cyclase (GGDEF)-like protein